MNEDRNCRPESRFGYSCLISTLSFLSLPRPDPRIRFSFGFPLEKDTFNKQTESPADRFQSPLPLRHVSCDSRNIRAAIFPSKTPTREGKPRIARAYSVAPPLRFLPTPTFLPPRRTGLLHHFHACLLFSFQYYSILYNSAYGYVDWAEVLKTGHRA